MSSLRQYHHCEQRQRRGGAGHYDPAARSAAVSLYAEAEARGRWLRLWRWLRRRPQRLRSLEEIEPGAVIGRYEMVRSQPVPLDLIVGSGGRPYDFDRAFYPLRTHTRERWVSVADLWYRGVELPPVSLVKVGDDYFVVDGHHRISVARVFGATAIRAHVTVWHVAEARAVSAGPQMAHPPCTLPGQPQPVKE